MSELLSKRDVETIHAYATAELARLKALPIPRDSAVVEFRRKQITMLEMFVALADHAIYAEMFIMRDMFNVTDKWTATE